MPIRVLTPIPLCSVSQPAKIVGKASRCDGGLSWCAVSPVGEVRTCTNSDIVLGNLLELDLTEVWQNDKCRGWQQLQQIPAECRECKAFVFCGGGCRACAYNNTGCLQGFDPCSLPANYHLLDNIIEEYANSVSKDITSNLDGMKIDATNDRIIPSVAGEINTRKEAFGLLISNGMNHAIANENGLEILNLCNDSRTIGQIIEYLTSRYEQPVDIIAKNTVEFLRDVTILHLVKWRISS